MPYHLRVSQNRKPADAVHVDAELFLLALRSYPEMFRKRPGVTFEQHFLSLVATVQSGTSQAQVAGR